MNSKKFEWDLDLQVRYGEVGYNGVINLFTLANWLQEAAGQNADSLDFGEQGLAPYDLTWILTRLVLRIHDLPGSGAKVRIHTWPSHRDRFAHRGYQVFAENGSLLVEGGSAWNVMSLTERKLSSIPDEMLERYPADPRSCLPFMSRTLPRTAEDAPEQTTARIVVRKDDLDINRHVNNAHYLSWLLESLPYQPDQKNIPALIDIGFRAECFPGEELIGLSCPAPCPDLSVYSDPGLIGAKCLQHAIRRQSDDVCRAISLWPA